MKKSEKERGRRNEHGMGRKKEREEGRRKKNRVEGKRKKKREEGERKRKRKGREREKEWEKARQAETGTQRQI